MLTTKTRSRIKKTPCLRAKNSHEEFNIDPWRYPRHCDYHLNWLCHPRRSWPILSAADGSDLLSTFPGVVHPGTIAGTFPAGNNLRPKATLASRVDRTLRRASGSSSARTHPQRANYSCFCCCSGRDNHAGYGGLERIVFSFQSFVAKRIGSTLDKIKVGFPWG